MQKENYSNKPLALSIDTQLLLNFLGPSALDEFDIENLENAKNASNSSIEFSQANNSQKVKLRNYCCIKFIKYLLENGKIELNIMPTAYSELMYSIFFEDILLNYINKDPSNINDLISDKEIQQIINAHTKTIKFVSAEQIYDIRRSVKDFSTYTISLRSLTTPNKELVRSIQHDVLRRIKENYFSENLQQYGDTSRFINFQYPEGKPLENTLKKDILTLAEIYRIDKKHPVPGTHGTILEPNDNVLLTEINDGILMAACSHLHLPLISEDTKSLATKTELFTKENRLYNKRYKKEALGEPFTLSDFIIQFFKQDFLDFVENFEVPEHILEIDKEHLIDQTINKIKNTPTTLIGENAVKAVKTREEEREIKNRERYNKAFSKTKQSDEVKFYTPEELFEDAFSTTKTNINYTVETNRETNPEILSQVITDKINSYRKSIQNLENAFWGIRKNKDGTLSEPSQDNIDIPFIATLSKESLYQLLVLANHLLKGYLYGKKSNQVQYEIYEMLNSFDINLIYDSNSQVCGIAFEGLVFTLPENKEKEDIKNKSLAIDYNTDDFSDNTALLLGTNGFTYNRSSIPFNLKKYMRNFKQQSKYKELQDIDFAQQLFEKIQQLNSSQNNENYIFRDTQILEFIFKIGQQQKICS